MHEVDEWHGIRWPAVFLFLSFFLFFFILHHFRLVRSGSCHCSRAWPKHHHLLKRLTSPLLIIPFRFNLKLYLIFFTSFALRSNAVCTCGCAYVLSTRAEMIIWVISIKISCVEASFKFGPLYFALRLAWIVNSVAQGAHCFDCWFVTKDRCEAQIAKNVTLKKKM